MCAELEFHLPVRLRTGGGVTEIRTPREASEALVNGWPATRGKWYYAANSACMAAQRGKTPLPVARGIFLQAIDESRLNA